MFQPIDPETMIAIHHEQIRRLVRHRPVDVRPHRQRRRNRWA
ncbi:MAG: hypothetical protein JWM34_1739 [Ilumatobacteraceae bacterium]|nr:hypothetical protein [Ilumatobacteraceae bacterium]